MVSLKTNVLFNLVNTFVNIAVPVITFPYAARVLQIEGMGISNFLGSIICYLGLICSMGIPMYAVKEVAKYRDDIYKRNQTTVEIALLSFLFCILGYVIVAILSLTVSRIHEHTGLFWIFSTSLFFTVLSVNWFFQAIEEFKFVSTRGVIARLLSGLSIFVFVRSPEDLPEYCFCISLLAISSGVINFSYLHKYIDFRTIEWSKLRCMRHLSPSLKVFLPHLITSLYGNLNIVMIGFIKDDVDVGIYSVGNKLILIVLTILTSQSLVLLPRCSNLIQTGQMENFGAIALKTVHLVTAVALPCMVGMMLLSTPLVILFCGPSFEAASTVVAYAAPVLLFIGMSNTIGIQILYPLGKQHIVVKSMFIGIVLNFVLDLILIPTMSYMGAVWSMLVAELVVLCIQLYEGRKFIPFSWHQLRPGNYMIATLVMGVLLYLLIHYVSSEPWFTLIAVTAGFLVYGLVLFLLKDTLLYEFIRYALNTIKRK